MTTTQRLHRGETAGESPGRLAKRLGIAPLAQSGYCDVTTYNQLLDLAVTAYWKRRPGTKEAA